MMFERLKAMLRRLKGFCEHVYVTITTGLVMLFSSSIEIVRTFEESGIGAHYGVALLGLIHVLKAIPQILDGAGKIAKTQDPRPIIELTGIGRQVENIIESTMQTAQFRHWVKFEPPVSLIPHHFSNSTAAEGFHVDGLSRYEGKFFKCEQQLYQKE